MKQPTTRRTRGFALFAVIILLAVVTAAVALTLEEAVSSVSQGGRARTAELVRGALEFGYDLGVGEIRQYDAAAFVDAPPDWDIFDVANDPGGPTDGILPGPPAVYPPSGPYQGELRVRVGARTGQRTRPPEGEDVTSTYGQIVELQISVDANGISAPAEERVVVGVVLPRQSAQAQ